MSGTQNFNATAHPSGAYGRYQLRIVKRTQPTSEIETKYFASARKLVQWLRENPVPADGQYYDLRGVDFSGQDLSGITFAHCSLSYADFTGANLAGSSFDNVKMIHTVLEDANMSGAKIQNTNLNFAKLNRTNFNGSRFEDVVVREAHMQDMQAEDSLFYRVSFNDIQAEGAHFNGASFEIVEFINANLDKTDFREVTQVKDVTAKHASLTGARMSQAVAEEFAGQKLYDPRISPLSIAAIKRRKKQPSL